MAKITRSVLKGLVKECLVEILLEGIDGEDADVLEESLDVIPRPKQKNKKRVADPMIDIQRRRDALDSKRVEAKAQQFEEQTAATINGLTQDPTMAAIFADTAATTLREQVERPGRANLGSSGDAATQLAAENNPEDLFSGANNWADLAFSSQKPGE